MIYRESCATKKIKEAIFSRLSPVKLKTGLEMREWLAGNSKVEMKLRMIKKKTTKG